MSLNVSNHREKQRVFVYMSRRNNTIMSIESCETQQRKPEYPSIWNTRSQVIVGGDVEERKNDTRQKHRMPNPPNAKHTVSDVATVLPTQHSKRCIGCSSSVLVKKTWHVNRSTCLLMPSISPSDNPSSWRVIALVGFFRRLPLPRPGAGCAPLLLPPMLPPLPPRHNEAEELLLLPLSA